MRGLPFTIKNTMVAGGWKEVARFSCVRCDGFGDFPLIRHAKTFNPEATIHGATAAGWLAKHNSTRAECPTCTASRSAQAKGESPGKKTAEVIQMQLKPLQNEHRLRIRDLLDKHFDDSLGRYLDGYSDQKVADEVMVPRAHVEGIRETAYGPIRNPPELDAATKAVADLEASYAKAEAIALEIASLLDASRKHVAQAKKALGLAA